MPFCSAVWRPNRASQIWVAGVLALALGLFAQAASAQAPDEVDAPDAEPASDAPPDVEEPESSANEDTGFEGEDFGPEVDAGESGSTAPTEATGDEVAPQEKAEDGTVTGDVPDADSDAVAAVDPPSTVPFGLSPRLFSTLVVAGSAAASLVASTAVGAGALLFLLDVHFTQRTLLDPMVGVFVLGPAVITAGLGTTIGSAFVLEGRGPMATGLVTSVATLAGAGAAIAASIGIAALPAGDLPVGPDFVGAMTVGAVGAFILGTIAGTAAGTGMAFAFVPKGVAATDAATDSATE